MGKYRVLVIAMSLKNNKIAKFDEEVEDSQLNSAAFDLIKDGFIEEVTGKDKTKKAVNTEPINEGGGDGNADASELDKLKADYLTSVKEKADLPKETKPADLAKAGKKISDFKDQLINSGVEFDEAGNIVNPAVQN